MLFRNLLCLNHCESDIEYTEKQLLDIGLTVIRNTRDFEKALGEWEALATTAKTWITFKSHFKTAQQQLKAIRGTTMQQAGYHHASHLAQTMRSDIERRDEELVSYGTNRQVSCTSH